MLDFIRPLESLLIVIVIGFNGASKIFEVFLLLQEEWLEEVKWGAFGQTLYEAAGFGACIVGSFDHTLHLK